jgi:hypothetical protein
MSVPAMSSWIRPVNTPLGVKDTLGLQHLGKDRDGRVDGVGDDEDESLGAGRSDGLGEGSADTGVDLMRRRSVSV